MAQPEAPDQVWHPPTGLTAAQIDVVNAPDPVLCVLAGAGTGKTRVLTLRVVRRVHDGTVSPHRTLVCTFSRKAADELGNRFFRLGIHEGIRTSTFHGAALGLIRQYRLDHATSPPIVLEGRRRFLSELLADGPGLPKRAASIPAQIEAEIGWAKARLIAPDDYFEEAKQAGRRPSGGLGSVAETYARYEIERKRKGVLDFDDLLWEAADLLSDDRSFADAVRWRNRHLFVDEMQDVNPAQFRLLRLMIGNEPDLCVVGDPCQSIYGWNGADPTLLDRIPEFFDGVRFIHLAENHRCTPQVVHVAAAILAAPTGVTPGRGSRAKMPRGFLRSVADEASSGGRHTSHGNGDASDVETRDEGRRNPTSTRRDGERPRFIEHLDDEAEARWIAQEIRRLHRPGRRWSRIAVLARTNAQLGWVARALEEDQIPSLLAERDGAFPAGGTEGSETGHRRIRLGIQTPGGDSDDESGSGSGSDSDSDTDDGDGDGEDELDTTGDPWGEGRYGAPASTPHSLAPSSNALIAVTDGDAVVLTTFHRAKGLQWSTVFVMGLSDGLVPYRSAQTEAALEEEQRLLYVALTRAEDDLVCTWAKEPGAGSPKVTGPANSTRQSRPADPRRRRERGEPTPRNASRHASRWWPVMVEASEALAAGATSLDPRDAAARLRAIRESLTQTAEDLDG